MSFKGGPSGAALSHFHTPKQFMDKSRYIWYVYR